MARLKKSRFVVEVPVEKDGRDFVALFHTMSKALALMPGMAWHSVTGEVDMSPDDGDTLCEQGFLLKEDTDETAVFHHWKHQHVYDSSTVKSKVLVTRQCNNRCRYCILDAEAGHMSPEVAKVMDDFYIGIINERNPKNVSDDYLGGEPLLNPGVILESASRRFHYCLGKGVEYSFTITTNGTLVNYDLIAKMQETGLGGIRVSMAGPAPVHDALRPSKENGKTYDRIVKNLQAISGQVRINIECQYDSGSQDYLSIPVMLDDFKERGIVVENIAFTAILRSRKEDSYESGMGDPKIALFLMQEAEKRGYPQFEEPPSTACMADFQSKFIFDTDGSIIPCPSVQGGEMAYGHVNKGIDFILESQKLNRILPEKCLKECPILPICMGGCRLQALVGNNGFNGIDCHYDANRFFLENYIMEQASRIPPEDTASRIENAA
ncbi:MAG: radical SAM protein [Pseudomonadota bacterium]